MRKQKMRYFIRWVFSNLTGQTIKFIKVGQIEIL